MKIKASENLNLNSASESQPNISFLFRAKIWSQNSESASIHLNVSFDILSKIQLKSLKPDKPAATKLINLSPGFHLVFTKR